MSIYIVISAVIIVLVVRSYFERTASRTGLEQVANELGFHFEAEPDSFTGTKLLRNSIIFERRSNLPKVHNLMSGMRSGHYCSSVQLFVGHGKSGNIQTVVCVDLNTSKLPSFAIQEKSLLGLDKLISSKEKEYVSLLDMMEIFHNHVVVVDKGATNVSDLPNQFLRFFVNFPEYSCEYISGRLLIYRASVVVPPNQMRDCIDNAVHLGIILEKV